MTLVVKAKQRLGTFSLDASFTSERGITALFGRSGSGKTSMIRIIAGLARPDNGHVIVDGDVMTDTDRRIFVAKHRRRFGYVFQEARLFPHLSVRHNLSYGRWFGKVAGPSESLDRIVALLGIESLLERKPEKLSGGERQRVAIGRALLSTPRLLLMDEPLAALDDARKAEVMPYLERLRDEMDIPIVYVSHSIAEVARLANQVVVMRDGEVEAIGPAVNVLNHPPTSFERRDAGALLEGKVESVDTQHRIATIILKSTQLHVPGAALTPGKAVRVRIPSRDVMLAMRRPEALSALNVLEGTVQDMTQADDATIDVLVDCGGDIILSRITSFSAERLGVCIGAPVFAVIKTVALEQ